MFATLRSRLIASYVLVIVTCLAVTGVVLTVLFLPQVSRLTYLRLAEQGLPIAWRVINLRGQSLPPARIIDTLEQRGGIDDSPLLIVDGEGTVLASTEGGWVGRQFDISLQPAEGRTLLGTYSRGRVTTVLLSQPRQMLASLLADISIGVLATGAVALLVSVGVALLIARSIAKPLQRITIATEEIARGDYQEQLQITSPEEIARLATSFNAMAHEVQTSRQAQRDFVANVSHDLKTPLTSIQGFAQAILDGTAADQESRRRAARIIHEEADRMARLVNDLLDLARIEAGQVVMDRQPVELQALLQDCVEKVKLRAEEAQIAVQVESDRGLVVAGDRDRLAQVFGNLLDNALKHTPPGGRISLAAQSVATEPARPREHPSRLVEITVTNTGEGIPPEDLSRIFERFYRGDKSRTQTGKGSGLGLAIAQEIVRAHGGQIRAESVVGLGTKFTITLPQPGDGA
jgi:two-component system OmpR family sensor kinase